VRAGLRVEAVVPARDEAETIGPSLASLVAQRFPGEFHVTLVDDHSSDLTRVVAHAATHGQPQRERFALVSARALEGGWTGKVSALDSGVRAVLDARGAPDFWFFTDADIVHDRDNVAALVAKARLARAELVSLMVRLRCESAWEKLLVPAFVFFFQKLYPFAWSNDPNKTTAAAAGGCILIAHDRLETIGGLASIRDRLIDDCALAERVKRSGGRTWLGLTQRTASIRSYGTLGPLWSMVKRTAFAQLDHSYPAAMLATAGMMLLYLAPPAATVVGLLRGKRWTALAGGLAWSAMAFAYLPTLRAYRRPAFEAVALPAAAALYTAMTVDSALAHARRRGGEWKGRVYRGSGADDEADRVAEGGEGPRSVEREAGT